MLKLLPVLALLLPLGGRVGVVFPAGADLGAQDIATVEGYTDGGAPTSATITFDSIRTRTYRGECLSFTSSPWLFDWSRGNNLSIVEFTISGSTFKHSFVTMWGVLVMDLTGGFDGVWDYDGTSGETVSVVKQIRETQPIAPEHLALFVGETVDLTVRYYGFTSIAASGQARATVDEAIMPSRVTVRYQVLGE